MKGMIYKVPIKHKEETPTQALTKDIQNNLSVIKDDIVASSQENVINGENLDDFIYHHFLNRLDPVEYCENVLRHHLPESRQKLHENQTALIRAVCNPKLKQVAGMMSRQSGKCFAKGTKILMEDGSKKNVEDIKVGDYVMSPTSEPRLVTNLGHGYEDMFEIIPNDIGYEPFTVNASHIISLIDTKNNIFNIEIKDYLKLPLQERKTLFGYRANINYQYIAFDFNVYNLGKILSNKEKNVFDKNIQDYINHHTNNDILYDIKINSLETRLLFLSGFVDGKSSTIGKDKIKLKIDDFNFACEMLDLIRSVGMKANLKQNKKTNSIYFFGRFSLLSSVKTKNLSDNNFSLIFKFKVKPKGIGEYFGFTIDSPDHLFLLGDYTVTHNTESISSFCGFLIDNYPQMRVGVFTPRLQQAEVSIGRLSTFFQMNEDRLNNKIVKLTKDRIELSNKSYVTAVSASDQSNIEGLTFDVIVLDEAQKVSDYTFSERIVPMGN